MYVAHPDGPLSDERNQRVGQPTYVSVQARASGSVSAPFWIDIKSDLRTPSSHDIVQLFGNGKLIWDATRHLRNTILGTILLVSRVTHPSPIVWA